MKLKRLVILCLVFLATIFNTTFSLSAQAYTFGQCIPAFGLYCEDSEIIKSGSVQFDLTDTELLAQGKGIQRSEYQVAAVDREVEFAIPFISSAREVPSFALTVNGQKVEGSVWYGDNTFWMDFDFDINKVYSPVLDESIMGTLFTVIPDSSAITVSLSFTERNNYIYDTSNHYSSVYKADGSNTWILENANSQHEYYFFVFGDATKHSFDSSCEYRTETISCKEFVDNQYEKFEEYYNDSDGIPVEFFYSLVNRMLQENFHLSFNELFFPSFGDYRLNAYKFSITVDKDALIIYECP